MSAPSAASPAASADPPRRPVALHGGPVRRLAEGAAAMSLTEWRKLRHDQLDLVTRSVQPLLWLFVFGTAMSRLRSIPTPGGVEYRAYLTPGVMAQAAMFVAIFFGLAVIWERDVGQLQRLLATPLPRTALVLGKACGAATRAIIQAILLLIVVAIAGIGLDWSVWRIPAALVLLAIGTGAFACLSMTIASLVKQRERFIGIGQLILMPLFFASSALYPLSVMPGWLHVVARVNPLTYEVEGLRGFLLGGGHPGLDLLVCVGWLVALAALATRAYPKAIL
jgi:ABC-2 type transport system permease protein